MKEYKRMTMETYQEIQDRILDKMGIPSSGDTQEDDHLIFGNAVQALADDSVLVAEAESHGIDLSDLLDTDPAEISLNNGGLYMDADEAVPIIKERNLWDAVVQMMDDETREKVHDEIAPCTEHEFLERYLEIAPHDLVVG
jgi:hypothetical protein